MKKLITTLLRHWVKTPVKISLTLLAVALGTGILILSFSASQIIQDEITSSMNKDGIVLQVVNGEWGDNGQIEMERPSNFDASVTSKLVTDSSTILYSAVVSNIPVQYLTVNGKSYQIRSAIGTDQSYLQVFSLDIIAGSPMTQTDYDTGLKKVWVSRETAEILFNSPENAIGKQVSPPATVNRRGDESTTINYYSVAGVYENPSEVARRAYGIADVIFPVTSMVSGNNMSKRILDFMAGSMVIRSSSTSIEKVTAEVNQVIANNYGDDIKVTVWEGNSRGVSTYMEELRQTVSIFSVSVRILGIVLLLNKLPRYF
jgi:putative ABC transport system permease protein